MARDSEPTGTQEQMSTRVKREKVSARASQVDKGKRRRREPSLVEDEEEVDALSPSQQDAEGEEEDHLENEDEEGSPRGVKRTRINDEGDARPSSYMGNATQATRDPPKTLPRGADGYIPGSIVRIQLRNFVTYDFVEFSPGPYLNMILGPNGTGKSSIACAIALGLNWPPSILGRANEINSFVKNGEANGHIEIELKGAKGRPNLVIRRNLSSTSKSSTFTLNGKQVTGHQIKTEMKALNVQVGNLCSFLPQDKVSEFAQMTPQQLLKETQRAAGNPQLEEWHNTLIKRGKEHKTLVTSIQEQTETRDTMQERNNAIERDVQRFNERKIIERNIDLLNVLIPVERYRMKREQYLVLKARQRELHKKVKALREKNAPAHALLQNMEDDVKRREEERDAIKKDTQAKFGKMKTKGRDSEELDGKAETLTLKLEALKKEEKERAKRIKAAEAEMAKINEFLNKDSEVKMETAEELNAQMTQLRKERQPIVQRKDTIDHHITENVSDTARITVELEQAQNDLKRQDDVNVRKLQNLANWDKDTHDTVIWLRNNRKLFKMEVFEPACLSVTVPAQHRQFVNAVEACFTSNQLRTFIAQCQEDVDTFNHYINDSQDALGRPAKVSTFYREPRPETYIPAPMNPEELAQLGFDGYAIDYLDFPEGMRPWLERELNLHRTPIALNNPRIDVSRAMEAVVRPPANGANFINGNIMNMVSRSRYGRKALSNMTREILQARTFVGANADQEVMRRIHDQIKDKQTELSLLAEKKRELDEQLQAVKAEDAVFRKQADDIKQRLATLHELEQKKVKARTRLKRVEDQLQKDKDHPSADQERARIKRDIVKISYKRIDLAKEYAGLARSIIAEQKKATMIALKCMQTYANRDALKALCDAKDQKYRDAVEEFQQVDAEYTLVKADSIACLEASRLVLQDIDTDIRAEYDRIETARTEYDKALKEAQKNNEPPPNADGVDLRTLVELEQEIDVQRAQLELNLATNPGVVEQYEKRKREIEQLAKKIESDQKDADKIQRDIDNAKTNWKPALEKLVGSIGEKFSAAFDRFGCAGEIRIREDTDYDKWAIDILVKFRDTEKLQLLTAQRQSGGERSLTTILYLLSLTEEARAPFSLVDEINQGMDQRAERTVHNNMVEVTCNAESAQYFLITPKLLPDLRYHERMKILCVNNGEWLPEDAKLGNMGKMIDGFLAKKSKGRSAQ